MTAKTLKLIAVIAIAVLLVASLAACAPTENDDGKHKPIYTGMSTSGNNPGGSLSSGAMRLSGEMGEAQVLSSEIPTDEENAYPQNEDIFITVHFDNPDNYTIMAFTLNGKPYASYMFEYGSDYENIIIKINLGEETGVIDYTIDAIQYADRDVLKYVEMQGDPTISVRVLGPVRYTVNHYVEKINGEGYDLKDTQKLIAIEDSQVTPKVKDYYGYKAPKTQKVKITKGEDIVIDYYYTRNTYTVTLVTNGGNELSTISAKYNDSVSLSGIVPSRAGYTFGGWYRDDMLYEAVNGSLTVEHDISLYAYWREETITKDFMFEAKRVRGEEYLALTGYGGRDTKVVVPAFVGGLPVLEISRDAFRENQSIQEIDLSSITKIGDEAFAFCEKLTQIDLSNVKSIGDEAFYGCINLKRVVLNKIETIGEKAFYDCGSVTLYYRGTQAQWEALGLPSAFEGYEVTVNYNYVG